MNAVEIRGNFVSLIAQVQDPRILGAMFQQCLEVLRNHDPLAKEFPPALIAQLDEAIPESDDESNDILNEEAFKLFETWAN